MRIAHSITLVLALISSVTGNESVLRGAQKDGTKNLDRTLQDANIVELAASTEDLSTLASLLEQAGFLDVLSGDGPFTVFAPTNKAFGKLPKETLTAVTSSPQLLADVLNYHVIPGAEVFSSSLTVGMTATTAEGSDVTVSSLTPVTINDAVVTTADITASNGVIHIIDTVLIPPDDMEAEEATMSPPVATESAPSTGNTIVDLALATPELSTLAGLLDKAGFVETLQGPGPFTVFAPTNRAFQVLPGVNYIARTPSLLSSVLLYHVVPDAELRSTDLTVGAEATTLEGRPVEVRSLDPVTINRAVVTTADIEASNGIIHIIDAVLIPLAP